MIFPWACISQSENCDYSEQMEKCFTSIKTKYMSVISERQFTQRALTIALEAKLKKQVLYTKPEELALQTKTLESMKNELKSLDKYPSNADPSEALLLFLDQKLLEKTKNLPFFTEPNIDNEGFSKAFESVEIVNSKSNSPKKEKKNLKNKNISFLPIINKEKAFITEPIDLRESMSSKILNKSRLNMSKFALKDSKIVISIQNSIKKRNYNSISMLPKLKDSITQQNQHALNLLEHQIKVFRQENDFLNCEK